MIAVAAISPQLPQQLPMRHRVGGADGGKPGTSCFTLA